MAKKASTAKAPEFEACLKQLDEIVAKLESGKLGLAESLQHYEKGVQHLKDCYKLLHDAERRIELVSKIDPTGRAVTEPFEEDESATLSEKSQSRSNRRSAKAGPGHRAVDDESSLF